MDLTTSGLAGTNEKFNNILKKIDSTTETMKTQIQADASTATSAISSELSSLKVELRNLIPEGTSLPNINLQSQLESLSGLVDPTQAANLLASITTSFGTELSASGFDLDTLITSANTAITGGKSLSFDIPNFEKSSDGLSGAIQKAVAVKIPSTDSIVEAVAKFTENDTFTSLKTAAESSVLITSTTLPTVDTDQFTITDKSTNITQGTITKAVTTAEDAIEGLGAELKRKNISSVGFANRPVIITQVFTKNNIDISSTTSVIKLNNLPTKITRLRGTTEDAKSFDILLAPISNDEEKQFDTFTISGNELTVSTRLRKYEILFVVYSINSTYDPNYKSA